jgi:PfaD family protein
VFVPQDIAQLIRYIRHPLHIVQDVASGRLGLATGGQLSEQVADVALIATLPPMYPEWLGDRSFNEAHGTRFPYVTGAMANGIATPELVVAMSRAGMLGFYGAAGLSYERVAKGLDEIEAGLAGTRGAWGANLIHSPNEASLEARVAELFIARGVPTVEASAYMKLTPAIVHYALSGLTTSPDGQIVRHRNVFAKVSRPEVARHFMAPAPASIISALVSQGKLTPQEAHLAQFVALAEDITVESDSGGHTDNRPLPSLFPEIAAVARELELKHGLVRPLRVGAAGGLGTPRSVASAFAMGAAFVLTGSVNQACVESGLSAAGRKALANVGISDVMMAPAADMFELGVELQVLKRGSLFGPRAKKLYELYLKHGGLHDIRGESRKELEKILGVSVEQVLDETIRFWQQRDPAEAERASRDPKHQMALVFRWYLGKSSRWAIEGTPDRVMDYQIWCGPAMGAFNTWTKGTFLEDWQQRSAVQVALNLLEGATLAARAHQARSYGVPVPAHAFDYVPRPLSL